jgi:hypothetical protein
MSFKPNAARQQHLTCGPRLELVNEPHTCRHEVAALRDRSCELATPPLSDKGSPTRTPSAPDACATTKAGVGPTFVSNVLFATSATRRGTLTDRNVESRGVRANPASYERTRGTRRKTKGGRPGAC